MPRSAPAPPPPGPETPWPASEDYPGYIHDGTYAVSDPRPSPRVPAPSRGGGNITTFIVDSAVTVQALEQIPSLTAGGGAGPRESGEWTHADMVAYSVHRFSDAPLVSYGLLDLSGGLYTNYLAALQWIVDRAAADGLDRCIINHSWGGSYDGRPVFSTQETALVDALTARGCVFVAAAANWKQFEVCEREVDDPAAWTAFDAAGLVGGWVVEDFPQFHSRGEGFIIGMYNAHEMAFPARDGHVTVGCGPCTLMAPGVYEPVGPTADDLNTGSSFAAPIVAAHLNCYWTARPGLTPAQVVTAFAAACFADVVLGNTPYPNYTFAFTQNGNINATYVGPTRTTRVLNASACPC